MVTDRDVRDRTVADFGNQWQIHGSLDDDHWSSVEMFADHFGGHFDAAEITGKDVAEVGSGSGRIVNMICSFRPRKCYAIEPSAGFEILKANTRQHADIVDYVQATGESFDLRDLDLVFSLGVIHHIKDPADVVANIHRSLKDGGTFLVWVYGHEGNRPYLMFHGALSWITRRMPDAMLDRVSAALNHAIQPYIWLCRRLPLPLRGYLLNVFAKCGWEKRKYIIFDQLNPAYAKYYRREELLKLLNDAGFHDVRLYHRHGYSWTAIARKGSPPASHADERGACGG